ncbi:hypothetical protein Zm00014a_005510 [Zea mays]|uniref:Uncharacterized protein n=1 Tax=Zea mays TaxID=4577 RepID=A0A3L6FIN9_MAIZE|nr:hypothetical protein Zm00014a_005510 [Zea mays]
MMDSIVSSGALVLSPAPTSSIVTTSTSFTSPPTLPNTNRQSMLRSTSTSSASVLPLMMFVSMCRRLLSSSTSSPRASQRRCSWSYAPVSTSVANRVSTVGGGEGVLECIVPIGPRPCIHPTMGLLFVPTPMS